MQVKKAVFPVAGLGTRFLPATKSSPQEMLPLIDKPLVHYVVEEAGVLSPVIFPILERQEPGRGGEIQLTDAIRTLMAKESIYGCRFEGTRYDGGDKFGFLKATVDMALKRGEFNGRFKAFLHRRLPEYEVEISAY